MLKSKEGLEKYLEGEIRKISFNTAKFQKVCEYNYETFNVPKALTSDYLSLRNPLAEANEFVLFCLLSSIEQINEVKVSKIKNFYNEKEIKMYSTSKFQVETIKFPLRFKAIQISEDQWMTSIDFKTLMKYRAAQLIVYNENTQRTMKRIIRGEEEAYIISINKAAIEKIVELYKNNTYIPTPFTFNIPLDTEADFYFDEEKGELVIKSLEKFDIVDGYHRYLAACKVCDQEKNFDFKMELRIINFSEDRAQQFIYQEDQKTIMTKDNSKTFDQNDLANRIIKGINESPLSNLQGLITRNKTLINYTELADLIKYFYLSGSKKEKKNELFVQVKKELIEDFNILTEYNTDYLSKKYSYKQLVGIMYCFNYFRDKDKKDMCPTIEKVVKELETVNNIKFYSKTPKKTMMNEVEHILKGVIENDV